MNISRFFGSTNREALRQVRLALGPDALIVSNRRVNGGVEILAADPTSAASEAEPPARVNVQSAPAPSADLLRELGAMRGALESRFDDLLWGNQLKQSSHAAVLYQSLLGCGFSTPLLRAMLKRLPSKLSLRASQEWVRSELARNLPVLASEDELWQPGLTLALVGPTGVGKTTTIAKLAARAVKRHGAGGLALLTTDTYRIGAYEQLKIYGELLRVPVKVIKNADELATVLKAIPAHVTVLIDNVGVSQRDRYVAEQAAMLASAHRKVTRLLVLNASSHGNTLDEVARSYSRDGGAPLQGCIITKADEATSLGAALDAAIRYRLPIHYVSNGQKVPENLVFMSPEALVDRAIAPDRDVKGLYSPSQADFAALMSVSDAADAGRSHDAQGIERLLGALLAGEQDAQNTFRPQDFQAACDAVEDMLPVAEAWDVWQALATRKADDDEDARVHIDRMLRSVRLAGHARPDSPVLAVHGDAPLLGSAGRKGRLRASMLLDNAGHPLVSAAQQVSFPDGWWSSCGAMAPTAPTAVQALSLQIENLQNGRPDWSAVHCFERGSQALLRRLCAENVRWISRIGAVSRVIHDGSLSTVSGIARALSHHSVPDCPVSTVSLGPDGSAPTDVMVWVATTPVDALTRNHPQAGLLLLSVKLMARNDGRELKHLFGLAHMADHDVPAAQLAGWLLAAYEARALFRTAARMVSVSGPAGASVASPELPLKALLATQSALASQDVLSRPSTVGNVVQRLGAGDRAGLTATGSALHKLFALKMWLAQTRAAQ
ncbi:MAG TPA: flagellar biosynthesis protein FlhF [Burkholderiaceae bacterium]|nr:flagellar biosynthesis protein FlhF [Burkholderiaceae bacterium]